MTPSQRIALPLLILLVCPLWTVGQSRSVAADGWVQGGPYHLVTEVYKSQRIGPRPILVVVLHGDAPFNKPGYQYVFAKKVAETNRNVIAVGLLRPGYTDPRGRTSDGERGEAVGDNWNATNTDAVADAIGRLAKRWRAGRVIVVGHSGGAAIAANVLGRHPEIVDAALLAACPCNVREWRESMYRLTGEQVFKGEIETLSADEQLEGVSNRAEVVLVVGSDDKVAPPRLSREYADAARKLHKRVRLVELWGRDHEILLDPAVQEELRRLLE